MNLKNKALLLSTTLLMSGSQLALAQDNSDRLTKLYHKAVIDASVAEKDEISDQLTAITPDNNKLVWNKEKNKILVVTWKSQYAYENYIKPYNKTSDKEAFVTWVTAVPEVKEFCTNFTEKKKKANQNKLNTRLKKLLGLNSTWEYDVFVELWVSPDDLFRPCTDPGINDTTCNLNFGESTPTVKNIADYKRFYQNLYYSSFRAADNIVPWTGLGYTYDWARNNTDVGMSEFIIVPSGEYEINKVTTTAEYCKA
ncbi:hypothetical protein SG34_026310 [Thalassomonas viridans]|uniref:Uncharacterized protein n=1 Tax=Thalassomonas viridans TaxID=137584 RepID=A0AAF0C922_9GAMM|nr:hypothetical protein [Thalassomonas viridans]WDE04785.1 hypothetical protein SG34_026310 [Thalassomonas viridans]